MSEETPKKKSAPKKSEVDMLAVEAKALIVQVADLFDALMSTRNGMKSELGSWEFSRVRSMGRGHEEEARILTRTIDAVQNMAEKLKGK